MQNNIISICINTYKRPSLLFKLLKSLNDQNLEKGFELEIIVVDNSPEKEGIEVTVEFIPQSKHTIKFAEQPIKNISITRNKAVSMATGNYNCFIDDDEYADENWVMSLYNCLIEYKADAVFGKVIPYYDPETPDYIIKGGFFNQKDQKTGELSKNCYTNNCLIKSLLIRQFEKPFLESLGTTGGEDVEFFSRIKKNGAILIHCDEAVVFDFVPIERANLKWLTKRYYRNGITSTENKIRKSKNKTRTIFRLFFRYLTYLIISVLLTILFSPRIVKRNFWFLKSIGNLGHLAKIFGIQYEEYK